MKNYLQLGDALDVKDEKALMHTEDDSSDDSAEESDDTNDDGNEELINIREKIKR